MGKSTLAIKLCKSWADGKLLQEYDAVILITLRDPEIQEAKDIADLLLHPDKEFRGTVCKEMMEENGNRVCFIGASLSEPHHRRSTVKSVFFLASLLSC